MAANYNLPLNVALITLQVIDHTSLSCCVHDILSLISFDIYGDSGDGRRERAPSSGESI